MIQEKKHNFENSGPDLEIQVQTNFKQDHSRSSPFASSMKRDIICLELEFRTSGREIQRQQYSKISWKVQFWSAESRLFL